MAFKQLDVEVRVGRVRTNRGKDYINLTIEDDTSGIKCFDIELTMEQFALMLTGSGAKAKATVCGLQNIGKVYQRESASVKISDEEYMTISAGKSYDEQKPALGEWLKTTHAKEGWHVDAYLGSSDSIGYANKADRSRTLNFDFRYVDKPQDV